MIVETRLVNNDGLDYGIMPIVIREKPDEAQEELERVYGEDRVYGSHRISDQFRPVFITKFDVDGDWNRDNDKWVDLLVEFLAQRIGYRELRDIVHLLR